MCLVPFFHQFKRSGRGVAIATTCTIVAVLVPFTSLAVLPLPDGVAEYRLLLQNILFLVSLAALFGLFAFSIDAPAPQLLLVFFLVMCYGFIVTVASNAVVTVAFPDAESDGYLYRPTYLLSLLCVNAVFFAPMVLVMRMVAKMLSLSLDRITWYRMAALPAGLVVIMLVGTWLPGMQLDYTDSYYVTMATMSAMVILFLWWMLRTVKVAAEEASKRAQLTEALSSYRSKHENLSQELEQAKAAVKELERALDAQRSAEAGAPGSQGIGGEHGGADGGFGPSSEPGGETDRGDRPIVISTSTHAVSFLPSDVLYAESLNRTRIVHLVGGESLRVNATLAQIAERLPADRFAYRHRSIIVNLDCVLEVTPTEVLLRGKVRVPMSRRRVGALSEALAARA